MESTIRKHIVNTSPLFIQPFQKSLQLPPTTVSVEAAVDTYAVTLTSVTGFSVGENILLASGTRFYVGTILSIATNTLTLDTPLDFTYPIGAVAVSVTKNMNVDGSSTVQTFVVESGVNLTVDIYRVLLTIVDGSAMDDAKFGSLAALTNGIILRHVNSVNTNIFNIKTNGDFRNLAYDVDYPDKTGGGGYSMGMRLSFDKMGSVVRLESGDSLELIVQDDLTSLAKVHMTAEGNIVE